MVDVSEEAIRAAMAPGVAKVQAIFREVREQMADKSADEVHAELVKRLQDEPFVWDDGELRKIAATIGNEPSSEPAQTSEPEQTSEPAQTSESEGDGDERTE